MLPTPDGATVLDAVARFLVEEVKVEDPALAFRLRIAAHLLGVVGRDLRGGEALSHAEIDRLSRLLGSEPPELGGGAPGRAAVQTLRQAVVDGIRQGAIDQGALATLQASLAGELALGNPRFVLGDLAEKEEG